MLFPLDNAVSLNADRAGCSGVARIFEWGGGGGGEVTEANWAGEGVGGRCPPSHGREDFENISKWHFVHIKCYY